MPKRAAIALLIAFAVTRVLSAWLAYSPDVYRGDTDVAGDVAIYHFYAHEIIDENRAPYRDVKIEYPPGSLILIALPYAVSADADTYRLLFIIEMIVVDALGAIALLMLGRRWRSRWGVWAWVFLIPFLGPIAHVRLDLVPAVLTIWAFERASAKRWLESGAAIGVGTAVKLYPIALLPILLFVAYRKRQFLIGAALPLIVALVPYLGVLSELSGAVFGYQMGRGLQVESTWGILLLFASSLGYDVTTVYNFGAFHVVSGISRLFDALATVASAAAALGTYWLAFRHMKRNDVRSAAVVSFALLMLLLAAAAVWSPQFLTWVIALAAVALCARGQRFRYVAYVLAAAGVASQIAYPFAYNDLLNGGAAISVLLLARNVGVAVVGLIVLLDAFPHLDRRRDTRPEDQGAVAPSGELSTESERPTIR
jgi:hypothetical protein